MKPRPALAARLPRPACRRAGEAAGPGGGQAQLEQAEHRQGEQGEERGDENDRRRRLQRHLQVLARPGGGKADGGEGGGHGDDVGRRENEAAGGRERLAAAGELPGEDRIHRQNARRKGEAEAEREEDGDDPGAAAVAEQPVDEAGRSVERDPGRTRSVRLRRQQQIADRAHRWSVCPGSRRRGVTAGVRRGEPLPAVRAGAAACRAAGGAPRRLRRGSDRQRRRIDEAGLRPVADAAVLAALVGDPQRGALRHLSECGGRHGGRSAVVIDLQPPKGGVVLCLARRSLDREWRALLCFNGDPVAVEIGAGGDPPAQRQAARRRAVGREREGLIDVERLAGLGPRRMRQHQQRQRHERDLEERHSGPPELSAECGLALPA